MNTTRIFWLSILLLTPCVASSDSVVVFNEIMYHPASDEESEPLRVSSGKQVPQPVIEPARVGHRQAPGRCSGRAPLGGGCWNIVSEGMATGMVCSD